MLRRWRWVVMLSTLVVSLGVLPAATMAMPASSNTGLPANVARACGLPGPGEASCFALRRTDITPHKHNPNGPNATPSGYGPGNLQSAYNLGSASASNGGSATVAIVDAYDNPNAAADLAVYRQQYGLPACGTGCFTKVNQTGGTTYPTGNTGWGEEISLDLDMVSAICPNCHILLVEANSSSLTDLGAAVNYAASVKGVVAISNSYGASEFRGEASYQSYYNHPGIAVTVSAGDSGYGVEFPAASQYVTAVGGTTLTPASNARGWSETVWSGTGSGCSAYISKPSWQKDKGCSNRTVGDVAADADPNTGVAVYDTYGEGGWLEFGGTSVASPIIASVYALAGNTAGATYDSAYSYANTGSLNDVTSGSNGRCTRGRNTSTQYLCTGEPGYDGPTGNGTPNGTGGF
ncbi:MAG TPA: S53 family peptidase [Thermomicrobiaceae bacterium]|nr:S53 family peptidase [Thermomicrobiaceae bacterium]